MGTLTDKAVQAAQTKDKQYGIADGDGLTLIVKPNGIKLWWYRYRFAGKAKTLSIGIYPLVTLREARDRTFQARKTLLDGADPSAKKRAVKAALTEQKQQIQVDAAKAFEVIAREWFEKFKDSNDWADNHSSKVLGRLEKDIFPWLGKRPIDEIPASELLSVVRRIENRGALETAHRALAECSRIFRYAVACGLAERDPSGDLKGALPPYGGVRNFV